MASRVPKNHRKDVQIVFFCVHGPLLFGCAPIQCIGALELGAWAIKRTEVVVGFKVQLAAMDRNRDVLVDEKEFLAYRARQA